DKTRERFHGSFLMTRATPRDFSLKRYDFSRLASCIADEFSEAWQEAHSELKAGLALELGQRHDSGIEGTPGRQTVGRSGPPCRHGDVAASDHGYQPAAFGELVEQRLGYEIDRARNQDDVVGSAGGMAGGQRRLDQLDIVAAERSKVFSRGGG